jgi:hypothetical protein
MRQYDGHLYAAVNVSSKCSLSTNVKLVEISPEFELRTIFQTSNVSSVEVTDLEITSESFVLVGKVSTFLPTSSVREAISADWIRDNYWSASLLEKSEDQLSAFVLVVGKNGAYLGDRVFSGTSMRSIKSVVAVESRGFVTAGETGGERGWIMAFSLQNAKIDLWDSIRLWLKGMWTGFGWAH